VDLTALARTVIIDRLVVLETEAQHQSDAGTMPAVGDSTFGLSKQAKKSPR
jgi:hypothetical protein